MVERNTIRDGEQVSEELLGVKVYFKEGLVTGLESADGKRTSVNYLRKLDGHIKYDQGVPVVGEIILSDGSKIRRDLYSGEYLDVHGQKLYSPPIVHKPSMDDNQAFVRYIDTAGNEHTIFPTRGDVTGPCLPTDKHLLKDLWLKNLPAFDLNADKKISSGELVRAIENPAVTGMDAVFVATLKRRFDIVSKLDNQEHISERDIEKLDRGFQNTRLGYTGNYIWESSRNLDSILNSWVQFQNKTQFVSSKLYEHGSSASIRPEYVLQGDTGNCYWQSTLMAMAKVNPKWIENMIKPGPDGTWKVLFPQKRWCNEFVTVSPLTTTEQLLYSGAAGGGQWAGILEKALAGHLIKYQKEYLTPKRTEGQTLQDVSEGGEQIKMLNLLTDTVCETASPNSSPLEKLHEQLCKAMDNQMPMGAGMVKPTVRGLHGNHNYAILSYDKEKRRVTMYDPNHYFEAMDKKGRIKDGAIDGIFTVSLEEFKSCCDEFNYLSRPLEENVFVIPPIKKDLFVDTNIIKLDGKIAMATQDEAIEICKKMGGHLPTAREYAQYMNPEGILEVDYVEKQLGGRAPDGYYKVECENDGKPDVFYFNNSKAHPLSGDVGKLSFWTSSKVLGNVGYGHVFYGWLGGGRPSKDDHAVDYKHAVLILRSDL